MPWRTFTQHLQPFPYISGPRTFEVPCTTTHEGAGRLSAIEGRCQTPPTTVPEPTTTAAPVVPCPSTEPVIGETSGRVAVPTVRFVLEVTANGQATISPPGATVDIHSGPSHNGVETFCYSGPVTVVLKDIPDPGFKLAGWQIDPNYEGPVCAESGRIETETATCTVTITAAEIDRALPTGMVVGAYPYVALESAP